MTKTGRRTEREGERGNDREGEGQRERGVEREKKEIDR